MLCSKCGDPIRPIVSIDIDGTMGDYHKHFLKFAMGYMGRTDHGVDAYLNTFTGQMPMRDWFCNLFEVDVRTFRDIKLAYRQGGQKRNMPMRPWASNFTNILKERAEIWLTTTRPYLRLDGVDPDTRFWLHNNMIYYDHLLYHEEKYSVLAQRVDKRRVVAVVDDLHEELVNANREFGDVGIMYRTQHNKTDWPAWEPDRIAHEGQSLKTIIWRRLNDWYERYGTHGLSEESGVQAQSA